MSEQPQVSKPDAPEMEKLLVEFAPTIRYIAQRLSFRLPPSLDVQDLIQAGIIGLMDALGKYDPSREARFKTYAEFRIRGAMLDEIRSLDWVPRSVRDKIGRLQKTFGDLEKRLGRAPQEEEVAQELEMSTEEFNTFLYEARAVAVLSLDNLGLQDEASHTLLETLVDAKAEDPLRALLSKGAQDRLIEGINRLSEKERLVVSLYYQDELTMKEIGQVMKITESRVCQLHSQAILRLKEKLRVVQKEDA